MYNNMTLQERFNYYHELTNEADRFADIMFVDQGIPERILVVEIMPDWAIDAGTD